MDQEKLLVGDWGKLHFIENEGMAFGLKFGGEWGKIALTVFRLIASIWGFFFIRKLVKEKFTNGLIFCASLILAGAIGNLIDCLFYGMIFSNSGQHAMEPAHFVAFGKGYGKFMHGKVVDMLYFPIIKSTWPSWVPFVGGKYFEFFRLIFNIADFAISTGVISILVFQGKLFNKKDDSLPEQSEVENEIANDTKEDISEIETALEKNNSQSANEIISENVATINPTGLNPTDLNKL
jgi:signal peptidase II